MNITGYPVVALVGQRNVGKSTLFNKLTRTHDALVANYSGLTRDRKYGRVRYKSSEFFIVDTGGFDNLSNKVIKNSIDNQTIFAIQESNVVLLIIDGQLQELFMDDNTVNYFQKLQKDVFIVINKIDDVSVYCNKNYKLWEYRFIGFKNIICISAMHNYGLNNLLKQICSKISVMRDNCKKSSVINTESLNLYENFHRRLPNTNSNTNGVIKLAIVGRPNSGKSTFVNYVSKKNRMITSSIPGTTRDCVYVPVKYNNQNYILIDTAGVRKKKKIDDLAEQISVSRTLETIKVAHVTLFMIDLHEGVVEQDLSLLKFVLNNSKALIILINKWDTPSLIVKSKEITEFLFKNINFLNFAKVHLVSSLYGNGIKNLFNSILNIYKDSVENFNTAQLTRIVYEAFSKCPPPLLSKKRVIIPKPKYVHIGGRNPITIVIHGTQVSKLPKGYRRYLKKYFYYSLNLHGVVLHMKFKDTDNPFILNSSR